jgi:hypothetical protein
METKTEPKVTEIKALSASRIKTLESCSWLYWCNYQLKLPQIQNDGARKGEVCHSIFELLLDKRHNKKFKKVVKNNTVTSVPSIARLIRKYGRKVGLDITADVFKQLDEMILVGLKSDFFVKGATLISPEYKFDLLNPTPRYHIKGFMDKPFMTDKEIIIDDFKSSKKKFEGADQESNVQAMIYSLAALKLWPDRLPTVRFIFLQFPDDPMMQLTFSKDALNGFEYYLATLQKRIDNFTEKDATSDYAYDMEAKNGEFKGKLMCGFAKAPTDLKKDGTKKWHCPYKFPFDYWAVFKDGKMLYTTFTPTKIIPKEGESVKQMRYTGCPKFNYTPSSPKTLNIFRKQAVLTKESAPLEDF